MFTTTSVRPGLVDLVSDQSSLPEGRGSHSCADIFAPTPSQREVGDALYVVEDCGDESLSNIRAGAISDPPVEVIDVLLGFRCVCDAARHERAAHLLSKWARTSAAGIALDGSAFSAS